MNWFDILVLVIAIATFIKGYTTGLVMQLATLAGFILGGIFAGKLSEWIAPHINDFMPNYPHIINPISYIVAFALILVGVFFIGKAVSATIKVMQLSPLNRFFGAMFCSLKWLFVFSIGLNLILGFDQDQKLIKENVRQESITYPYATGLSSIIIPFLKFDWFGKDE